jgi:hypothetical protein
MATKDGFRLVRADHAEKPRQPGSATAWRRIKAAILGATAAAIALAVVSLGNPSALVTKATAFLVTLSAPQDGKLEKVPIVQSSAEILTSTGTQTSTEAQASPPTASERMSEPMTGEPKANETKANETKANETKASELKASEAQPDDNMAAPVKTADQRQPDIGQASPADLLGRFQAWAARDHAQAEAQPAQPAPVQPAPVQPAQETQANPVRANTVQTNRAADPVQDARAEIRPVQNHRPVHRLKNARAEIRVKQDHKQAHKQDHRAKLRREQNARLPAQPAQDARDQDPPVQNARTSSFLESLGLHD